ncbi:MAG: phosphoribosyltransferase family protein [bacterium]|nr:phosphoribosyltransferase family protein [bacterium]
MLAHLRPGVEVVVEDHGASIGHVPHLRVSWTAYFQLVDELICLIADEPNHRPNQIIGIVGGGFIPARAISQALGIPLALFAAESYGAVSENDTRAMLPEQDIRFDRHLLRTRPGLGTRILVVDDLTDSGRTLRACTAWLKSCPELAGAMLHISTAVLWNKYATSAFRPDCYVDLLEVLPVPSGTGTGMRMPWIDQPMESQYPRNIDAIRTRIPTERRQT